MNPQSSWKLDVGNAVNFDHPLGRGRRALWYGVHGGGGRLTNLMPGGRFHGSRIGNPTWTPSGRGDSGLQFSSGNYVSVADAADMPTTGDLSVSWWMRAVSYGTQPHLFGFYQMGGAFPGWAIRRNSGSSSIEFWDSVAWRSFGVDVPVGTESHLTITATSSLATLYRNGIRVGSVACSARAAYTGAKFIGSRSDAGEAYNGFLSDPSIFSRVLSPGEAYDSFLQSVRGYRTPDSPLRWIRGTEFGVPLGGGSTTITPAPISLRLTPVAPTISVGGTIAAPALSQRLTPVAPSVRVGTVVAPSPTSLRFAPVAPSVGVGSTITPAPLSLRLSPVAPTVTLGVSPITPTPLSIRLSPVPPTVRTGTRITPTPLVARLSPVASIVRVGNTITAPAISQRLTAVAPTVRVGARITPSPILLRLTLGNVAILGGATPTPRVHPTLKGQFNENRLVTDAKNQGLKASARNNNLRAEYPRDEQ